MLKPNGTNAGIDGFYILRALIEELAASGHLSKVGLADRLGEIADEIGKEPQASSKGAAVFIRDSFIPDLGK